MRVTKSRCSGLIQTASKIRHVFFFLLFLSSPEKLKLDRDFSKYNYLSLDSATVNGLDDAANFRTVRVSYTVTHK